MKSPIMLYSNIAFLLPVIGSIYRWDMPYLICSLSILCASTLYHIATEIQHFLPKYRKAFMTLDWLVASVCYIYMFWFIRPGYIPRLLGSGLC